MYIALRIIHFAKFRVHNIKKTRIMTMTRFEYYATSYLALCKFK